MMADVLISIQPKWVEKICNQIGFKNDRPIYEKEIEVRKTKPNKPTPFRCLIYCTKGEKLLKIKSSPHLRLDKYAVREEMGEDGYCWYEEVQGKVVGEFVCDRIDEYDYDQAFDESMGVFIDKFGYDITSQELEQTCLSYEEFEKYGNTDRLYGWHISQLKIYDKPKELSEFKRWNRTEENIPCAHTKWLYPDCKDCKACNLTRPPQSWCYVEELQE